jgi:uncharacterized alkaline shock family protein YloU
MTVVVRSGSDAIAIPDGTLAHIVVQAAEAVEGVRVRRPRRKLALEVDGTSAHVELELAVAYGTVLPAAARAVQEGVAGALERMCGLEVRAVDVTVEELDGR